MPDTQPQDSSAPTPDIGSMLPPDDKSITGLVSGMTGLARDKVATDKNLSDQFDVTAERDRKVREAAFNAEGVAANNTPKPWDANKEHKKFETDPIEGFGSVGGLFAMVASAFTKAPMENAINGMAGAINSIKEGNEKAYERAYDSFKENVKLADHRFKMQHDLYNDALSMSTTNAAVSSTKFHNAATKYGDSQMLMLAEHGMIKEIYELQAARAQANEQAVKAADATTQHMMQQRVLKQEYGEIDKSQLPPELKEVKKLEAFNRVHTFGAMKTEQQETMATWAWQHRQDNNGQGPTAEERAAFYDEHFGKGADTQRRANEYIALKEQAWRDSHDGAEAPPDERAKWTAEAASFGHAARSTGGVADIKNGPQLKIAQIKEIQEEGKADGKWQNLNEAEAEWKKRQSVPSLSPEEVKKFGEQLATGDTSVLTNIGRGAQSSANVLAVRKAAYDVMEARGQKPADLAMLNARYQGLKAAERASATQEMKMGAAAWEASNQADLALSLSDKLPRSRIVPFNAAVQKFEQNTSNEDMNAFASANNTFVNSYVRAISPTGISTDLVRKHAYDMLNTALSDSAYRKVVDVLKQEMRLAVVSPGQMLKQMEAEYKHNANPNEPAAPGMPTTQNPLTEKSGVIKYDKDGNRIP